MPMVIAVLASLAHFCGFLTRFSGIRGFTQVILGFKNFQKVRCAHYSRLREWLSPIRIYRVSLRRIVVELRHTHPGVLLRRSTTFSSPFTTGVGRPPIQRSPAQAPRSQPRHPGTPRFHRNPRNAVCAGVQRRLRAS